MRRAPPRRLGVIDKCRTDGTLFRVQPRCARIAHMGTSTETQLGERVRELRLRSGLSQDGLAAQVGLDRSAVTKIEKGARRMTALELVNFAEVLRVRIEDFFQNPPEAVVSYRSHDGLDVASSELDADLEKMAKNVNFLASLPFGKIYNQGDFGFTHKLIEEGLSSISQGDELAVAVRNFVGLDGLSPVADVVDFCGKFNVFVFSKDFGESMADAGSLVLDNGGVAIVNSARKVGRRRLAALHELGHILCGDPYSVDWRIASAATEIEGRLDSFARSVLLPGEGVVETWSMLGMKHDLRSMAVIMASQYSVDMATLARRLRDLNLIDASEAGEVRSVVTNRADIIEFGLKLNYDLEGTSLPDWYSKEVLRLVRAQKLSPERGVELLLDTIKFEELPKPAIRDVNETWGFVS